MIYNQLPAGHKIKDRYRIEKVIGQGAFGMVYLADDLMIDGAQWAIKEIWEGNIRGAERDEAIGLFRKEAQILSSLNHTGVPKMVDFFSEENRHYMVMEYVDGRTLEQIMEDRAADVKTVVAWALKICDILEYLHDHKPYPIIFRDIKPSNILVTPRGRILLIDFGIARFFNPVKAKDTCDLGTPGFCAPEQYGKHQSDVRSDIYALGATIYFLLSREDLAQFAFKIPPLSRFNGMVEGRLVQALARCLECDPSMRFQDIQELRHALLESDGKSPSWPPRFSPPTVQPVPAGMPAAPVAASPGKTSPFHWSYRLPIVPLMWVAFIISIIIANESEAAMPYIFSLASLVILLLFALLLLPGYIKNRQYGSAAFSGISVMATLVILIAPAVLLNSAMSHKSTAHIAASKSPMPSPAQSRQPDPTPDAVPMLPRNSARTLASCVSNLKNLGVTLEMYTTDNIYYPPSLSYLTPNYIRSIPTCPVAEVIPYHYVPLKSNGTGLSGITPGSEPRMSDPCALGTGYILYCSGNVHRKDGIKPGFPQYSSVKGIIVK
jgi:serine/threonine protein kinase, bacterial